jgi:DNA polymerase-3 subunit epsilon
LCTVKLSRRLFPREARHNLDALMDRHGLVCDARHRALGDAKVLADFLRIARERWASAELAAIVERLVGSSRLPPQLDPSLADELPEGPGAYLIFGEEDELLYVGKARNLATRVPAHFADSRAKLDRELTERVRRIEWIETAGELGAALAEARLIRDRRPALNRKLHDPAELWAIRLREDGAMPLASIAALDAIDDPGASYGLFRRRVDAERALAGLARTHGLCAKWLGVEHGEGSCLGFQLGRCRGVCVGREPPALHAVRARLALAGLKRRDWPFPGAVGIRERDWRGVEETHVFDRWCYADEPFDPDVYRILAGFIDRGLPGARLTEPGEP